MAHDPIDTLGKATRHNMLVNGVDPPKLKFDCNRCKPSVEITLLEVHPDHLPKRLMIYKPMKVDGKITLVHRKLSGMSERLRVRLAYHRGWQVVDGSTIVDTFATKEDAFCCLVDRGGRVLLAWRRTILGGQSKPCDFSAEFQTDNAGRIMKEFQGPSAGRWFWFSGSSSGSVETKNEAVFCVERLHPQGRRGGFAALDPAHRPGTPP
ncbi:MULTISPECIES: hypothetical protein [unclassified Mesorhizobium]|uniref:hypothetical protein n=2 Tax=unclassified Mesorhizobium TaxID=325217 RepID=UPI001CCC6B48|nr:MULTISPECIES: hypothetical protein [unclassified Mesorhizobium]MBZ9696594.1 hypothetical protein [Mesorhizobium sp. CO1-1-9]